MTNRTIKHNVGDYTRTDGNRSVSVQYFEHLRGWIAAAEWDCHLLTDPVETKRNAVFNADSMLKGAGK